MLTVHHLDYSRSTRVLWLLEELGLPYHLQRYSRPKGGAAPEALKTVHPLGKSPVLVDGDLVLAESSAILRYVDREYGEGRFTPTEKSARARHDEWLDYIEGSLAIPLFVPLATGDELAKSAREKMDAQLSAAWDYIEDAVAFGSYLVGDELSLADMQMVYTLAVAQDTQRLQGRSVLLGYLHGLLARPALVRAIAAGGPMA